MKISGMPNSKETPNKIDLTQEYLWKNRKARRRSVADWAVDNFIRMLWRRRVKIMKKFWKRERGLKIKYITCQKKLHCFWDKMNCTPSSRQRNKI